MAKATTTSLIDIFTRVAAARGEIVTRIDSKGVEVTLRLPHDLVNAEMLRAVAEIHARKLKGK